MFTTGPLHARVVSDDNISFKAGIDLKMQLTLPQDEHPFGK